jgi:hypothetical protein
MQITEFTRKPTSKELNESLAKRFGQRVDVDSFTLDQLHDARNKLRTKLSQVESKSKFESVLNDDTYQKAKLFLDVINTAIDEKSSIQESENEAKKVGSNKETPEPYKAPAKGQCKPGYVFDIKTGMCNPDTKAIKESIIREGEEEKAQLIMAAKDMVDRITGWLEDTAEMQTESMLELGDSIRDEMGSDVSQQFIDTVKPALEAMYNTLADSREKLSGALGILTGEGAPPEQMGADTETPAEEPVGDETPAEGEDEFAASEPAAGGEEPEGRAKRESVDYRNLSLLLAGQKKRLNDS